MSQQPTNQTPDPDPGPETGTEETHSLARRPKSLRDPAGGAAAPLAIGTIVLLLLCLIWAAIRYNDLEDAARGLAATQPDQQDNRPPSGNNPGGSPSENENGPVDPPPTDLFPTELPPGPEEPPPPAEAFIVPGIPGVLSEPLTFDPVSLVVELGTPVVVRNTSQRQCTMTVDDTSDFIPAMLEGENPVLESAALAAANHTVTFLSPDEPASAALRCDEVTVDPDSSAPAEEEASPTAATSSASPGETETDPEGEGEGHTVQVLPSKVGYIVWRNG